MKDSHKRHHGALFSVCCLLFIVHSLLFTAHCLADSIIVIDAEAQFGFAADYFSAGEYLKAVSEYERFLYFFPDHEKATLSIYNIGLAYFKAGQFQKAANAFDRLIGKHGIQELSEAEVVVNAYFMLTECYVNINAAKAAVSNLRNLLVLTDDPEVIDKIYYRIGWIYLEAAEWENAREYFEKIRMESRDEYNLDKLFAEMEKKSDIPKKSPTVAGTLAAIPGAGYVYCERYHDAFTSFLLNTLMMYAAYEAFDDENYALGGLIGLVGLGFYSGNIYGSITAAHKYNRTKKRQFINRLQKNLKISIVTTGHRHKGIGLVFQYAF